jgi:predicted MFS family arabinose efflux permease
MTAELPKHHRATAAERKVILGASLGTVFEWYDFYLYGLLASIISAQFFAGVNETTGFLLALGAFAAGFAVRPFGALVFGRLGDLVGRKRTFLVTMGLMGAATFLVGVLPTYASIGVAAPIILVGLRMVQGLALGGEYGGAAIYVAEHAPNDRRGLYTSFIQTTATVGLFLALLVVIAARGALGEEAFRAWGWRIPFLVSVLLLGISLWIRMQLEESPVFQRMKAEGATSKRPLAEAFANRGNLRLVLVALFGAVAGQAVVWYTGQFYALFFLERLMKVDGATANLLVAIALALATPGFILFGWLSDRIGRKPIILAGLLLAATTYIPIFDALERAANPALADARALAPVTVEADPGSCSVQFDPVGRTRFDTSACDIAKSLLAKSGTSYAMAETPGAVGATVRIGGTAIAIPGSAGPEAALAFETQAANALTAAGYPATADPSAIDRPRVVFLLTLLVLYVTMVYGPIAALLVELFPARIRYSSMSLPYHIGNGWFGGFLPAIAFATIAATGRTGSGLWYPIAVAALSFAIGLLFLPETRRRDIDS